MSFDLSEMQWLNPPIESRLDRDRLVVRSGKDTDFWQGTY